MDEVGKILPSIFKRQIERADPRLVEILTALWPRVVGKAMASQSRPVAFEGGTLTLATDCTCWSAQLRQMAEEIRAAINSFLGGSVVKELRVRHAARLDPSESPKLEREFSQASAVPPAANPGGADRFDAEMGRVPEGSSSKHFARRGRRVH